VKKELKKMSDFQIADLRYRSTDLAFEQSVNLPAKGLVVEKQRAHVIASAMLNDQKQSSSGLDRRGDDVREYVDFALGDFALGRAIVILADSGPGGGQFRTYLIRHQRVVPQSHTIQSSTIDSADKIAQGAREA
jgi:hypothetical protein